ncbi:Sperm-associated antigen 16 protein [Tupaia chinensis]|uniref:Sperm-associated antigen 16 protein n=1 Tax=Tupaia chinensis TaxID=246437 RepID=L9LCP0_TUPCH|nr:Sperm-associated antigen 16 protein [Tupaia chinensis]
MLLLAVITTCKHSSGTEQCITDDNFSIPEGDEDLAKAIQMVHEQAIDTQILEQKTVLPSRHAVPEVIEDFLCNFLIKMGMTRTLDCFQSEWYELIQKGVTELRVVGTVPDVYTQIMFLEAENKNLKKDLKHYKQATDKAREDLLKTQKERDFHRMHHKRIVQEKNKLINDLKGLKLHYASYEPTIRVLHEKHHSLLKQKMLTTLERDRAIGKVFGLKETLRSVELGRNFRVPEIKEVDSIQFASFLEASSKFSKRSGTSSSSSSPVASGAFPSTDCLGRASASLLKLVRLSAPSWVQTLGSISVSCFVSAGPVMVKVFAA